jgi:hypothetical protein
LTVAKQILTWACQRRRAPKQFSWTLVARSRSMGHGAWDEPMLDITVDTATPCQVQITAQRGICRGGHGKMWGVRVDGESA